MIILGLISELLNDGSFTGTSIQLPILSNFAATASTAETQELEVAAVVSSESDVMPSLGDIGTTYTISDTIPPPLTSLTTLTTTSTLESVLNEPIMSVAVADSAESSTDINSMLQS